MSTAARKRARPRLLALLLKYARGPHRYQVARSEKYRDILLILGLFGLVIGAAMIYRPAAPLMAGLEMIGLAWLMLPRR